MISHKGFAALVQQNTGEILYLYPVVFLNLRGLFLNRLLPPSGIEPLCIGIGFPLAQELLADALIIYILSLLFIVPDAIGGLITPVQLHYMETVIDF